MMFILIQSKMDSPNKSGNDKRGVFCKGQATTELAILGSVIIMLLSYLLQQGFSYEARQSLEMYTFREALRKSREDERGVSLTVVRDIINPSFFSNISRQRLTATASVEYNPWYLYLPDKPQHIGTKQYVQIGEAMIKNGHMIEIPPTHMRVEQDDNKDEEGDYKWNWTTSSVKDMDRKGLKQDYKYTTKITETGPVKEVDKSLESTDTVTEKITFETADEIKESYKRGDWEGEIHRSNDGSVKVDIDANTIPKELTVILNETVKREYNVEAGK